MQVILTGNSISNGKVSDGLAFVVADGVIKRADEADLVKREIAENESDCANAAKPTCVDLRRFTVLPGLIDIHVHGGNGFDTMDGKYEAINGISAFKLREGVTSFCPATVTASGEMTDAAIQGVNEAIEKGVEGAKVLGLFLEGPYINPKNKGAHPLEFIRPVCLPEIKTLVEKVKGKVSIAIAPELPGSCEAIKALAEMGIIIRIGHSSATLEEAEAGVEAGASVAIHTYNAMSALNHREPGMVGAAMTNESLFAEIICDLVHVHPTAMKILVKTQGPDKVVLMTDCMSAGGLADGEYMLGALPVFVRGGVCRLKDGTLAGSSANLLGCVRNMHKAVGLPLADAVTMATSTPARIMGLYDSIGSLEEGKQADIIAIDEDFNLRFVMVDGIVKYENI